MIEKNMMREVYEHDGVCVGWLSTLRRNDGARIQVFVPRRDEEIEADRRMALQLPVESLRR